MTTTTLDDRRVAELEVAKSIPARVKVAGRALTYFERTTVRGHLDNSDGLHAQIKGEADDRVLLVGS